MSSEPRPGDFLALIRNALSASRLFSRASPEWIDRLAKASNFRQYRRGDAVSTCIGTADHVLLAVSGLLEISLVAANGRRFVMGIAGPGEVIGLVRLFAETPVKYGYVARENAAVVHMPCSELHTLFDSDPARWRDVCEFAIDRKSQLIGTVLDQVVIGGAEHRIAATLRRLSKLFGVQRQAGTLLKLRLSQDDLADMLCVSRQTVNKELHRLETAGVIGCAYNTITILQPEALSDIADQSF